MSNKKSIRTAAYALRVVSDAAKAHASEDVPRLKRSLRELAFVMGRLFEEKTNALKLLGSDLTPSVGGLPDELYANIKEAVANGKDATSAMLVANSSAMRDVMADAVAGLLNSSIRDPDVELKDTYFDEFLRDEAGEPATSVH